MVTGHAQSLPIAVHRTFAGDTEELDGCSESLWTPASVDQQGSQTCKIEGGSTRLRQLQDVCPLNMAGALKSTSDITQRSEYEQLVTRSCKLLE